MVKKEKPKWRWRPGAFEKGLKVSPEMAEHYQIVAEFTEKVAENPEAYKLLKERKKIVDKEVYEKLIMRPNFIMHFISLYNTNRPRAYGLLKYLNKQTPGRHAELETIRVRLNKKLKNLGKGIPKEREYRQPWIKRHFGESLKATPTKGSYYHLGAKLTEKIGENAEAYRHLKRMESEVDKRVYKNAIMHPNFISKFIDVYRKDREAALNVLEYAQKKYKEINTIKLKEDPREINRIYSDVHRELETLWKSMIKRIYGKK